MKNSKITLTENIESRIQKVPNSLKYWQQDVPFIEAMEYILSEGMSVWTINNIGGDFDSWIKQWTAHTIENVIPEVKDGVEYWPRNNPPKFPSRLRKWW